MNQIALYRHVINIHTHGLLINDVKDIGFS